MLVVGGESLIDLISEPCENNNSLSFIAHAGGSPYNCSIALAKLDNEVGFLCPFSKDDFGDFLLKPLLKSGVIALLERRVSVPSSLAIVNLDEQGKAKYQFYRNADRAFSKQDLISHLPAKPELFQIGGFCAIEEKDMSDWFDVANLAKAKGATVAIDANVRPNLVSDFNSYKQRLNKLFSICHIIKMSDEDLLALDSLKSIKLHVAELLSLPNCELVIISEGEKGSKAFTKSSKANANIYSPARFADSVGAGDCLMAGIISKLKAINSLKSEKLSLLDEEKLFKILTYGSIVAGLNCAHYGCHPPSKDEVELALVE